MGGEGAAQVITETALGEGFGREDGTILFPTAVEHSREDQHLDDGTEWLGAVDKDEHTNCLQTPAAMKTKADGMCAVPCF